MEGIIPGG
ncbi:hypothetical protein LINPERPRIM_LOCUS23962 [Linum perenne]